MMAPDRFPACEHRPDSRMVNTTPCEACPGPTALEQAAAGADGPTPVIAGTFAVYEDGRGGYVLVTDTAQYGTDRRHIPAAMVKMASGGGILSRKLAGVFGGA